MKQWNDFENNIKNLLCPSGNGVYTVNTAKEKKEHLHQKLYGQISDVEPRWHEQLKQLPEAPVAMLGICSDNGGGILRGANWGPLFLRNQLQIQYPELTCFDLGDIRVIPHLLHDKYLNDKTIQSCQHALYGDTRETSQFPVSPLSITEKVCSDFYQTFPDKKIFGIGGDHSVSYPLTKAYLQHKKSLGISTAIIHFDAHTDLLSERLGIDLCFGSWCTHILKDLPDPSHLIQLGIRSSAKNQAHWEDIFGIKQYWAQEMLRRSSIDIASEIIDHLKQKNVQELYVSFDIDALDAQYASATGTPETGGITPTYAIELLNYLKEEFTIGSADIMEIAPLTDSYQQGPQASKKTLEVSADITACLLEAMHR